MYSGHHMAQKILITDTVKIGDKSYPEVEIDYQAGIEREELLKIAQNYDAIITRSRTQIDKELIDAATNLKVIGRGGVGVDNIDLELASRRGILVLNAPEANNISAAELAIALMLDAARGVSRSDKLVRQGTWDRKFLGKEINGAHLGIIGLGRIGSLVAKRAQGLGMTVIAYDPYISPQRAINLKVELFDNLKDMLTKSDFLTVHTPLTKETKGIVGKAELACLPEKAIVVNAARGGIVEEEALAGAIKSGHVFAAGIDVFSVEPPPPDHPFLQLDNIALTAHLGANTQEAQVRVGSEILERTALALKGDISHGAVNAPSLSKDVVEGLGKYLELGEVMGKMVSQLAKGRVSELKVEFSGNFAVDPDPIAVAVTKGFLEPILTECPNYINAMSIAKERDIRINKVMASRSKGYTHHVEVKAISDEGKVSVGGTILADSPRIASINDYTIEIKPEGTMLICTNTDKPGSVGKIGTVLGNAKVNISAMQLSRVDQDGLALFVLTLDYAPSEKVLKELQDLPDVLHSLSVVRLGFC